MLCFIYRKRYYICVHNVPGKKYPNSTTHTCISNRNIKLSLRLTLSLPGSLLSTGWSLTGLGIPVINLRRSDDRLRFVTGIPIPIRRCLHSEETPRVRPWDTYMLYIYAGFVGQIMARCQPIHHKTFVSRIDADIPLGRINIRKYNIWSPVRTKIPNLSSNYIDLLHWEKRILFHRIMKAWAYNKTISDNHDLDNA